MRSPMAQIPSDWCRTPDRRTAWGMPATTAVSGSSIATTAIFGKMALPEMARLRYDKALSVGVIASAGDEMPSFSSSSFCTFTMSATVMIGKSRP